MRRAYAGVLGFVLLFGGAAGRAAAPEQPVPVPAAMKAIRVHEPGGADVMRLEMISTPKPGKGELLVRVHAAGLSSADIAMRRGEAAPPALPYTPGLTLAGRVVAIGDGVRLIRAGDKVMAHLAASRPGAYAEFAIVRENEAAQISLPYADAAAVSLPALAAWQALVDRAALKAGQTVLVLGGDSQVGLMAIQLARSRGATVIASGPEARHELLRELGAGVVIDDAKARLDERTGKVDVVLDTVGPEAQERSWAVLKAGGMMVSTVQQPDFEQSRRHEVIATSFTPKANVLHLSRIAQLVEEGAIKPVIAGTFPLEEASRAHALMESASAVGSVVIVVRPGLDVDPEPDGTPKLVGEALNANGTPAAKLPVIIRVPNKDPQRQGEFRTVAKTITNDEGEFSLRGIPQTGAFELLIGDRMRTDWIVKPVLPGGKSVINVGTLRLHPLLGPE